MAVNASASQRPEMTRQAASPVSFWAPPQSLCNSPWIADDEAVARCALGGEPLGIDSAKPGTDGLHGRWLLDPSPENPP